MTYEQAKKDFHIMSVYTHKTDNKGKTKTVLVDLEKENIPDNTEGKLSIGCEGDFLLHQYGFVFIVNRRQPE